MERVVGGIEPGEHMPDAPQPGFSRPDQEAREFRSAVA